MTITKTTEGNRAVIMLEGWLDTQAAPELGKAVEELGTEITELVLEMKDCEYISSSGVRQIVAAHKKMNGGRNFKRRIIRRGQCNSTCK